MKVLIFGLGTLGGGFASAKYFLDRGDQVRLTDLRSETILGSSVGILKEAGATVTLQEHREEDFHWADIVIKNPAIAVNHPLLALAKQIETDLSFLFSSPLVEGIDIIAISGTKGKTTTAATIAHVLNTLGVEALQCGNMGISGFTVLAELSLREATGSAKPKYLVCELSSWQIRDLYLTMHQSLPRFKMVVITTLFPDHLNTYSDFAAYKEDKLLLISAESEQIILPEVVAEEFKETPTINLKKLITIESVSGVKNVETIMQPAWAVCRRLGYSQKVINEALISYKGVPHRQEQVAVTKNIVFINDSAATIPEAVAFSTAASPWQFVLICGGTDKNLQPGGMLAALKQALSIHLLNGTFTQNKLIPLLEDQNLAYQGPFESMDDAFASAFKAAIDFTTLKSSNNRPLIALILSPGATSFGLFNNEFDRGDQFKALVLQAISDLARD